MPAEAVFHELDILDTDALRPIMAGAHAVFHLAALPRVQYSIDFPEEAHRANIDGTFSVLMAAQAGKAGRVIYAASSSAYGTQAQLPLTEDMPPNPLSPYGFQKYAGEVYARLFSENYGLAAVSLRFFSVYGPGMRADGGYALAIPQFLAQAQAGKPLTLTGDGTQTRDFTHVDDVVRACLLAMESKKAGKGEVINIAAGRNVSVNALADLIAGAEHERMYLAPRAEAHDTFGDITRAKELLGWEPTIALEEGIAGLRAEAGLV